MSVTTKIQWCDHTHNAWRGCRKVAEECANCYITRTVPFRMSRQVHGSERVRASEKARLEPFAWQAASRKAGVRRRVFSLSLGDWLDDEVPIEWLADLLATIHQTPHLDWLLLTKRPQNWSLRICGALDYVEKFDGGWETDLGRWLKDWLSQASPPANVWIGVSAGADQGAALDIPAWIHFLSCEPMLHAMDHKHAHRFHWIIFGGESGPGARPCHVEWIREGVEFCRRYAISPFVKQLGSNVNMEDSSRRVIRVATRDKKGGDPAEWPQDLRVREFPDLSRRLVQ